MYQIKNCHNLNWHLVFAELKTIFSAVWSSPSRKKSPHKNLSGDKSWKWFWDQCNEEDNYKMLKEVKWFFSPEKNWRREHNNQRGNSAAATSPVFHNSNATAVPRAGPAVPSGLPCRPPVTWAGPVPKPVPGPGPAETSVSATGGLREIQLHNKDHNRIHHLWVFLLQVSLY